MEGIVSHIQQLSVHDGDGIRTTVFLKGCDLRCKWCHNPETFSRSRQLQWIEARCIGCGECIKACKANALSLSDGGGIIRDSKACVDCGGCVEICFADAQQHVGTVYSVEELCMQLEADRPVYGYSGGGVTISGGEPMQQHEFATELAAALHSRGINVCMQTNMNAPWERYEAILPWLDYVMCDMKHIDPEAHRAWTGQSNRRIINNIRRLDTTGIRYCVRTPVIPGVNSDQRTLAAISEFAGALKNAERYELLPFHPLAAYKYRNLGMTYGFADVKPIPEDYFQQLKAKFEH